MPQNNKFVKKLRERQGCLQLAFQLPGSGHTGRHVAARDRDSLKPLIEMLKNDEVLDYSRPEVVCFRQYQVLLKLFKWQEVNIIPPTHSTGATPLQGLKRHKGTAKKECWALLIHQMVSTTMKHRQRGLLGG
jgi:hypothetical protein